jgi:hypothetical protein
MKVVRPFWHVFPRIRMLGLGETWLDSVGEGWTEASLHRLVVTNGTLSAAKSMEIYGHFFTKMQM